MFSLTHSTELRQLTGGCGRAAAVVQCRTAPADFLPALPRTGFHET